MICASLTLLQIMFAVHRFRSRGNSGSAAEGGSGALRAQIIKKPARTPVISTEAKRSGEISLRSVASSIVAGDLSTLRFIRAQSLCPIPARSSARDDDVGGQHTVIHRGTNWPKRCPDRQTAARLDGVSFEALAVQHPRATLWPSPPKGGARFSGTISCFPLRGNAAQRQKGVRGCV